MGTEKIVGRGGPKIPDRVGGKNMASGRGTTSWDREGVERGNFKKTENLNVGQKLAFFDVITNFSKKIPGNVEKLQFFGVREGVN